MTEIEYEDWYFDDVQISEWAGKKIRQNAHDKGCTEIWDADGIVVYVNPN